MSHLLQILTALPGLLIAFEQAQISASPQEKHAVLMSFLTAVLPADQQAAMHTKLAPFVTAGLQLFEQTQAIRAILHPIAPAVPTNIIDPSQPLPAAVMAAQVSR